MSIKLPHWIILITLIACAPCFALRYTTKIMGISGQPLENAQKRLEINRQSIHHTLTKDHIYRLYHEGFNEIKKSLTPFGYFKADIHGRLEFYDKAGWHGLYRITPGPRVKIKEVDFRITGEAKSDPEFITLKNNLKLKPGSPLNTNDYQEAKKKLLNLAAARGYFDATLQQSKVTIKMHPYQANIHLHLASGRRYHFGHVHFDRTKLASKPLSTKLLCRYIPFKRGEPFDMKKVLALQNNLASSHYFDSVTVAPEPNNAQGRMIPIHVELSPRKGKKYTIGFGFGTDTGVRGLAGIKLRRLNSRGHYFSGQTRFAYKSEELRGYIQGSYNIPGANPITDLYTFSAKLQQDDTDHIGLGQSVIINANYATEIHGWQQSTGLSLHVERSDPTLESTFSSTLLMPILQWNKVVSDDPLKPNNGYRVRFSVHGASEKVFSTLNFLQAELSVKYLKELTYYQRLVLRGDLGGIVIKEIEDLPVSFRFSAGGTQSVRGYGYQNIGPGRALVIGSIELQQRIYKDFYLTAFFDIGNASSSYVKNYNKGVGLGVLWRSPIGAVNLSLAQALDKPGKPYLLEFSMGPEL